MSAFNKIGFVVDEVIETPNLKYLCLKMKMPKKESFREGMPSLSCIEDFKGTDTAGS